ncbi:MAG: class I SAM-dependent methyltransferase [Bacteroidia bacterium]|nr:class I SAM-dependent methyltransferase [Bacteroidia bacterium]
MKERYSINLCPICNHSSFKHFLNVPDWLVSKEVFELKQCEKCQFVFTANAPLESEAGPYYNSEEYVEHSDTSSGLIYSIYHVARRVMLNFKYLKIKRLRTGKKLLDVGSGSGYFMNFMKKKGYEVTGVEISEKAANLCENNFGIKAHSPTEFVQGKLDTNYNIISLWHVFEHVYDYDTYFELFSKSLDEKGYLILALPNNDSPDAKMYQEFWGGYDTPRHIWHFTPKTIELFADKRGFKIVKKHRMPLDPFFNAMIGDSYKEKFTFLPITFLKGLYSYIVSLLNIEKSSSIIYIFQKKT